MPDTGITPFYAEYYDKPVDEVKKDLVRLMRERGIHRIEATYSGGHDEGGVQDIERIVDGKGNTVEIPEFQWSHPLWQALDAVLTMKFMSWALGMSVYGTLYVDLDERRAWTVGEQEVYQPDTDPISLDL